MNPVTIRNVAIGEGRTKICVPIVGRTKEEILREAGGFSSLPLDLAEWRADWYEDVYSLEKTLETAKELRSVLGEIPILFTFRTAAEGGEQKIEDSQYEALNRSVAESGYADLIDVEVSGRHEMAGRIIFAAHNCGIKVVGSHHNFQQTPPQEEIVKILYDIRQTGADILKIALMPRSGHDVLTLLAATLDMRLRYADRPLITMSMSKDGIISRLAGEIFGSAVTFGAASRASAPGQIGVRELFQVLEIIHGSL